jgi:hypothetical protein
MHAVARTAKGALYTVLLNFDRLCCRSAGQVQFAEKGIITLFCARSAPPLAPHTKVYGSLTDVHRSSRDNPVVGARVDPRDRRSA